MLDQATSRIHSLLWLALAVGASLPLVWLSWHRGREMEVHYRVSGPSMAPTLHGASRLVRCEMCQLQLRVSIEAGSPVICWHCGQPLSLRQATVIPADTVRLQPVAQPLSRGQLIAFEHQGLISLKRIVALPSDTVDVDGLRLRVNGHRIEDLLEVDEQSLIPVDLDHHRQESRWQSHSGSGVLISCSALAPGFPVRQITREPDASASRLIPAAIRTKRRIWQLGSDSGIDPPWLVYHHRNVHDRARPSGVWDDYPGNLGLTRPLEPVDRLLLGGTVLAASEQAQLEVAFWSPAGTQLTTLTLKPGDRFRVPVRSQGSGSRQDFRRSGLPKLLASSATAVPANSSTAGNPPLSARSPVAIRLRNGTAAIAQLSIKRRIEYRLRRRDDRNCYPLRVRDGYLYVLGDNVPLSIDSRNHGLIGQENVLGRIVLPDTLPPQPAKRVGK